MHNGPVKGSECPVKGAECPVKGAEYPAKGDLRKMMVQNPVPTIAPGTVDPATMGDGEPTKQARAVLETLNASLASNDAEKLESCFYPGQAYWKDLLALTYHTRTFSTSSAIAAALLETVKLRELVGGFELQGEAQFIPALPVLVRPLPASLYRLYYSYCLCTF